MEQVRVALQSMDPVSEAGLSSLLRTEPGVEVVPAAEAVTADVRVVSADRLTAARIADLRRWAAETRAPVVLIIDGITETELLTAVECRVVAVLPRSAATGERLTHAVATAASGGGVMPPNLVGELVRHIERLSQETLEHGVIPSRLTAREVDVVRLVADGFNTSEIATKLSYSERTVKNIIYGAGQRLNLRNRAHTVAYAVRTGII